MKQYVNECEISKITGLAIQTLRNWRHKGCGFPYFKIGRTIRYDLDDIVIFMQNKKVEPEEVKKYSNLSEKED
jgi:phage terminase Nu1 subunit (DNA packaging protein)